MREAKPSRTAFRVAMRRAAHQVVDHPKVLDDPLALKIIGPEAAEKVKAAAGDHAGYVSRSLRAFLVARSRYAEDELARAVQDGVRQYVLLGAGLDTFAYRNSHAGPGLKVFEVDHPATQEWKKKRLRVGGIEIPGDLVFVPVDFERETISDGLRNAGFKADEKAFFAWLGVTPYLTDKAFAETMQFIASMPKGSGIVFDYAVAKSSLNWFERFALRRISARVALAGEPFQLFFEPKTLADRLHKMGFDHVEDLTAEDINARYFAGRADKLRVRGGLGRIICARI
jgi:methyltransferase (TIGR00027 family)